MLLELALIAAVLCLVTVAWARFDDGTSARRQIEQRMREAEREIDEIGRRTQEAILAEAWRRAQNKRPGA